MINRVRGTQDLIDTELLRYFISTMEKVCEKYNFSYIETPILEQTKLFVHSLGSATDVVSKEMYSFPAEQEEDSICLRPEMTASTIRAYGENAITSRPWKVFSHGPVFRKERPQKGRWRQFSQFNIELINTESLYHDCSLLAMLSETFFKVFLIDSSILSLNYLGCLDDRKNHKTALLSFLETHSGALCETCLTRKESNTLRIFDCKNRECQSLYKNAPTIIEHLCSTCNEEWLTIQKLLALLSVSYVINHHLVRGLDYYNRLVFEFSSPELGAQSAFAGGGRYTLGKESNGKHEYPSVGVALGIGRLLMLLEQRKETLVLPKKETLQVILPITQEQYALALLIAHTLAAHDLKCDVLYEQANISNLMKKAQRLHPAYVLLIGPDEQKTNQISVKEMATGKLSLLKQDELVAYLKNIKNN